MSTLVAERYNESWEKPHSPTDEIDWQESDWFTTYDHKARIGITFRIGQEPNKGVTNANLAVWTPEGENFELTELGGRGADVPFHPEDRWETGSRSCGNQVEYLGDGKLRFTWKYEETTGDVIFTNYYEPRYWTLDGTCSEILSTIQHPVGEKGGHLESGGMIRGTVTFNGRTYQIDSPGHRDRSWGKREHYFERLAWFKFFVGDIGPELGFAAQVTQPRVGPDDPLVGFVARHGEYEELVEAKMIGKIDVDTGRKLGGTILLTLASGEKLEVEATFYKPEWTASGDGSFSGVGTIEYNGLTGSAFLMNSGKLADRYNK